MIAKEYTYTINEYFRHKFKNKEVTFINKESSKPCEVKFGDRREYRVEIWMVNFVTSKKEQVYTVQEVVTYENKTMKKIQEEAIIRSLWILTLNNINEIDKYGVQ